MEFPIKMPFNTFYKATLGLSSIVLVFSLFLPIEPTLGVSNKTIVLSCGYWILYSIIAWFLDIETQTFYENERKADEKKRIVVYGTVLQLIALFLFVGLFAFYLYNQALF